MRPRLSVRLVIIIAGLLAMAWIIRDLAHRTHPNGEMTAKAIAAGEAQSKRDRR